MVKTAQPSQAEPMDSRKKGNIEVMPKFVPTPERLSQYLERNVEEVMTELTSVEGREKLFQDLVEHEEDIRELDPSFQPQALKEQLDLVAETLSQKQKYLKDIRSPEKKGIFRRAWEKVKGFATKHPVVTALLILATAAATVAGAAYLAGGMEALLAKIGISHLYGAEGAKEAADALGTVIEGAKEIPNYFEGPANPDLL